MKDKLCKDCKHWEPYFKLNSGQWALDYAVCELVVSEWGDVSNYRKNDNLKMLIHVDICESAELYTKPDFSCVCWEAKENE